MRAEEYRRISQGSVSESKPCQLTCHNGARPFAQGERGAIGGASLAWPSRRRGAGGGRSQGMLRLLHTADVHLGARHADLGDRAATQRERQFAAFVATVDVALEEKLDLV